jgi:predicted transglutaminase-like cysteine proteinase
MQTSPARILGAGIVAGALLAALAMPSALAANERPLFVSVGAATRAPIGWVEFCAEYAGECDTKALEARDVVLTGKAWKDMVHINKVVNDTIKPVTDLEHWGVVERWRDGRARRC